MKSILPFIAVTLAVAACASPSEESDSSSQAQELCAPSADRSASSLSAIPFQSLNRGAHPAAITRLSWTYPWQDGAMNGTFGAGRSYNEGHEGTDLGGARGDSIVAASSGKVVYTLSGCSDNSQRRDITCGNGWGNHVVIDHGGGVFTRYAHLSKVEVRVGDAVRIAQRIGALGHSGLSDGPHLHFELGTRAAAFNPCAPPQNFDLVHDASRLTLLTHAAAASAAPSVGEIACPGGFRVLPVGTVGGKVCGDGASLDATQNILGPFTRAMVDKCVGWGGGAPCNAERWGKAMALSARGTGACPAGAAWDPETTYCAEGNDAFGPFPAPLVAKCIAAGGGETTCRAGRWSRSFLAGLLR